MISHVNKTMFLLNKVYIIPTPPTTGYSFCFFVMCWENIVNTHLTRNNMLAHFRNIWENIFSDEDRKPYIDIVQKNYKKHIDHYESDSDSSSDSSSDSE
jgi:hypothetical protein